MPPSPQQRPPGGVHAPPPPIHRGRPPPPQERAPGGVHAPPRDAPPPIPPLEAPPPVPNVLRGVCTPLPTQPPPPVGACYGGAAPPPPARARAGGGALHEMLYFLLFCRGCWGYARRSGVRRRAYDLNGPRRCVEYVGAVWGIREGGGATTRTRAQRTAADPHDHAPYAQSSNPADFQIASRHFREGRESFTQGPVLALKTAINAPITRNEIVTTISATK